MTVICSDSHTSAVIDAASNALEPSDAVLCLHEVAGSDPRLMIILAGGRIDESLHKLLTIDGVSARDIPQRYRGRIRAAHARGLIDDDLREFMDQLRWLRNRIGHDLTRAHSLANEPYATAVARMHELASVAAVPGIAPVPPPVDLSRSVFAATVAGVIAAEMSVRGEDGKLMARSFSLLRTAHRRSNHPVPFSLDDL